MKYCILKAHKKAVLKSIIPVCKGGRNALEKGKITYDINSRFYQKLCLHPV